MHACMCVSPFELIHYSECQKIPMTKEANGIADGSITSIRTRKWLTLRWWTVNGKWINTYSWEMEASCLHKKVRVNSNYIQILLFCKGTGCGI